MLRWQRVLLASDLAELYGVKPKRLNEQVKRNRGRFPEDFTFVLEIKELRILRSQIATLKSGWGQHRKYPPLAFTEHGAIMAATVLNSPRAVEMSVYAAIRALMTPPAWRELEVMTPVKLRAISSDRHYREMVSFMNALLGDIGDEESHPLVGLLDIVTTFVHDYEERQVQVPEASPAAVLRFLMEQLDLGHRLQRSFSRMKSPLRQVKPGPGKSGGSRQSHAVPAS